jgi:hypothetical protein
LQRRVEELENALEHRSLLAEAGASGTQFTCFTGTKVQTMTPEELRGRGCAQVCGRGGGGRSIAFAFLSTAKVVVCVRACVKESLCREIMCVREVLSG